MHSVLIVENINKWSKIFTRGLEPDYIVRTAETVNEAIGLLQQMEFDVVILNLHLIVETDYQGEKVLAAVVRNCPLTPCIVVSGYPNRLMNRFGRYQYQIYELVTKGPDPKGFDLYDLSQIVEEAIEDRQNVRRLLAMLDEYLSDHDITILVQRLISHFNYPHFDPPPSLINNTKKQRLGYVISVLVDTFGQDQLLTLLEFIMQIHPENAVLQGELDTLRSAGGSTAPLGLDANTVREVEERIAHNEIEEALKILCEVDGCRGQALLLRSQFTSIEQERNKGSITRETFNVGLSRIVQATLRLIRR